jgi:hypothetical protein
MSALHCHTSLAHNTWIDGYTEKGQDSCSSSSVVSTAEEYTDFFLDIPKEKLRRFRSGEVRSQEAGPCLAIHHLV